MDDPPPTCQPATTTQRTLTGLSEQARAASEVVLIDHDDFHWTLITEDDHTRVVQLARAAVQVDAAVLLPGAGHGGELRQLEPAFARHDRHHAVEPLATEYPEVPFIIPHLGSFADDWQSQLTFIDFLARHPNDPSRAKLRLEDLEIALQRPVFAAAAMDAAGYDPVLIETVGAGQSEVEVARLAETTLVVNGNPTSASSTTAAAVREPCSTTLSRTSTSER